MKILYITATYEDYLEDQILIGLRNIYGSNVVDYPKKSIMYETCRIPKDKLYGCGFTLYKTLPDIEIDRSNVYERVESGEFDIVIFGNVWNQRIEILELFTYKIPKSTGVCFLDGCDHQKIITEVLDFGRYFKRELISSFAEKINFSIPKNKIRTTMPVKDMLFADYVTSLTGYWKYLAKVLGTKVHGLNVVYSDKYLFSDESDYYNAMARSKYAITTMKGGWDCMRHYEIAANQTVLCFYKLSEKPESSAPHGLVDMNNVVAFNTPEELQEKIDHIDSHGLYDNIQANTLKWVKENTCEVISRGLINRAVGIG